MVRIVSWNINSVRARINLIERFCAEAAPDILCLQEIKTLEATFPFAAIKKMGFEHIAINGQKGHHGVATLSKVPFIAQHAIDWCEKGDARHIAIELEGGPSIHNFYVPAGGDIPDREENEKFGHKLDFLDEMIDWSASLKGEHILLGDLNIAPLESDVWSHKALLKVVSHTPIEVARMQRLYESGAWVDSVRHLNGAEEKIYSWWSYRAKDWRAADKGRRLDHIWVTPGLKNDIMATDIHKDTRGWDKPSDHAPLILDIDL